MVDLLERKIRLRAGQLYVERGEVEGRALEDWIRAESEVLGSSILAPLWYKHRDRDQDYKQEQEHEQELVEA